MKKVTISLPEWMIQEIDDLTKAMEDEFWNKANTWRQVIKKGLAYWSKTKKDSARRKANGTSATQQNHTTTEQDEQNFEKVLEMLRNEHPEELERLHKIATTRWVDKDED